MPGTFKSIAILVRKDFLTEKRTKQMLGTMAVFALLILVVFNFTLNIGFAQKNSLAAGLLWIALTFASTLGFNQLYAPELEHGNIQAIRLLPIDKGLIYVSKVLSSFVFLLVMEAIVVPLFAVFFNLDLLSKFLPLSLTCILGAFGLSSAGAIIAALAFNTRMREVLLPILLFPILVPLIIGAVESTAEILGATEPAVLNNWIKLLIGFDVVMFIGSYLTYEYILEE